MTITLTEETHRLAEAAVLAGAAPSVEVLVEAVVRDWLVTDRWIREFPADEMRRLIAESDEDIAAGRLVPAEQVFAELEAKSAALRASRKAGRP